MFEKKRAGYLILPAADPRFAKLSELTNTNGLFLFLLVYARLAALAIWLAGSPATATVSFSCPSILDRLEALIGPPQNVAWCWDTFAPWSVSTFPLIAITAQSGGVRR